MSDDLEADPQSVAFLDSSHGWLTAWGGQTYSTSDGGRAWSAASGEIVGERRSGDVLLPRRLADLPYASKVGAIGEDGLWLSYDAPKPAGDANEWRRLRGGLLVSNDSGRTWRLSLVLGGQDERVFASSWIDATHGWVLGDKSNESGMYQFLLRTEDGGETWRHVPWKVPGEHDIQVGLLEFIDESHAWAMAGIDEVGTMARTEDGGVTWQEAGHPPVSFHTFHALSADEVWGATAAYYESGPPNGALAHTTDAGDTWTQDARFDDIPLEDVYFRDGKRGWVAGDEEIYSTQDGGAHWTKELAVPGEVSLHSFAAAGDAIVVFGTAGERAVFYRLEQPDTRAGG